MASIIENANRKSDIFQNHQVGDLVLGRYPSIMIKNEINMASFLNLKETIENIYNQQKKE